MTPELWAEAEKWREELTRAARHRLGSQEEAEDVVSEVMLRCIQSCKEVGALRAMLHISAARKCTDIHRKNGALHRVIKQAVFDDRYYLPYVVAAVNADIHHDYESGSPCENAFWLGKRRKPGRKLGMVGDWMAEDAIDLRDLTDQLSEEYAQVIWLDYLGYDKATAAQMVGLTTSAYKSRLYRARQAIRDLYAKGLVEPEPDQDGPEHQEQG